MVTVGNRLCGLQIYEIVIHPGKAQEKKLQLSGCHACMGIEKTIVWSLGTARSLIAWLGKFSTIRDRACRADARNHRITSLQIVTLIKFLGVNDFSNIMFIIDINRPFRETRDSGIVSTTASSDVLEIARGCYGFGYF